MTNKKESEIKKDMAIGEVLEKYPTTISVFQQYGLHCVGCPLGQEETIEEAVQLHMVDLKKLLKDLNEARVK